jgi:serine/threonine protein phosphatase PrpC
LTRWRYAGATDTGLVRQSNQDAIYVDETLAMVADGMGGHAAGEVASAMATELIRDGFKTNPTVEGLYHAINAANMAVLSDARHNPDHFGMGTTVIAVGLTRDGEGVTSPTLFHVGDSRAYQLRDGALRQLSDDHSVAEEWVRMGRLTPEEAAVHPRRHQLTRGVGVEDTIAIDVLSLHAEPGDRILLCSDGLSNELDNDTLARLASVPFTLDEAVAQLVETAKQAGGRDNISAVLMEFDEVNVASTPIKRTVTSDAPAAAPVAAG